MAKRLQPGEPPEHELIPVLVQHFDRVALTGWDSDLEAAFVDFLDPLPTWRCLEAGCGTGRFTLRLAGRVAGVVGTDRSPEMIRRARGTAARTGVGNARFEVAAVESLPGPLRNTFDVVVAVRLLFFLPDPAAGLRQLAATVRPGGWVAVCNPHAGLSPASATRYADAHGLQGFARQSLASWARVAAAGPLWDEETSVARLQEAGLVDVTAMPALEGLGLLAKGRRPGRRK